MADPGDVTCPIKTAKDEVEKGMQNQHTIFKRVFINKGNMGCDATQRMRFTSPMITHPQNHHFDGWHTHVLL